MILDFRLSRVKSVLETGDWKLENRNWKIENWQLKIGSRESPDSRLPLETRKSATENHLTPDFLLHIPFVFIYIPPSDAFPFPFNNIPASFPGLLISTLCFQ